MKRFYQWSFVLGMCMALVPVAFARGRDGDHHDARGPQQGWHGEQHPGRDWRGEHRNRDWRSDREWREHRRDRYASRHRGWDGDHPRGWDKGRKEGWNSNVPPGQQANRYRNHRYHPVVNPGPNAPVQGKPHSTSPIVFPTNKQPANTANNQSH
jgi:hypothetical protein